MCGIAALLSLNQNPNGHDTIRNMTRTLADRGPDDESFWSHKDQVFLGHRRLSIIDLSPSGRQPMVSKSKNSTIVFNGEIYNFKELKLKFNLETQTASDTEVLLELIEKIGIEQALNEIRGMFAFALYQNIKNELILARDPFGEKPLYFGRIGDCMAIGSSMKVFHQIPNFQPKLNLEALNFYLKYNYVPSPLTMDQQIQKLPAGHFLKISLNELNKIPSSKTYLNAIPIDSELIFDPENILKEADRLFQQSIRRQLVADVPIGVFLSSGIDSSLVASYSANASSKKIQSFNISFKNKDFDESRVATQIANELGLDHHTFSCQENDLRDLIPNLSEAYDEPFSDSSQLPTMLLAKMTRKHVKVSLSGDGGDELFAGYNRYFWLKPLFDRLNKTPRTLKSILSLGLKHHKKFGLNNLLPIHQASDKLKKIEHIINSHSLSEAFDKTLSMEHKPGLSLFNSPDANLVGQQISDVSEMILHDQKYYLTDDILVKVDRATMAYGLESRAPFLDLDLARWANQIPFHIKANGSNPKWILKKLLDQKIPKKLIGVQKRGFAVPLGDWFRHELKDWLTDTLSAKRVKEVGLFNSEIINTYISEHQSGKCDWHHQLWNLAVFHNWWFRWMKH